MVAELWIRTIRRFQEYLLAATKDAGPGMDRAVAAVHAIVDFCSENRADARLMLIASRQELEDDPALPQHLAQSLRTLNDPVEAMIKHLAGELYGRVTRQGLDRVAIAVTGLPYTAVRRCLLQDRNPAQLRSLVADSARAVLSAGQDSGGLSA